MATKFDEARGLRRDVGSRDAILSSMKDRGLTIAQAIKESMQEFGVGLGDAKSIVTSHPAWRETAEAAVPFQVDLIQAVQAAEDAKP